MPTFAEWVSLPENRSALAAVEGVAGCVTGPRTASPGLNPLLLHGPAGCGKTHLVSALGDRVAHQAPDRVVAVLAARDLDGLRRPEHDTAGDDARRDLDAVRQADLVILEDLQHLPARSAETFVQIADRCVARERQLVLTANQGPAQLAHLPARVTSRLSAGLVVGLQPLAPTSRRTFLEDRARHRQQTVPPAVLDWLADHLSGSARELEGALARLEALARLGPLPGPEAIAEHFRTEAEARRLTVERIAQRVGHYFRLEPRQLQVPGRARGALLPRQIGMYLARQLTGLSLRQIGAYFGGRDHSTVLHACRKVEQALTHDLSLSGAVRQLHADLA